MTFFHLTVFLGHFETGCCFVLLLFVFRLLFLCVLLLWVFVCEKGETPSFQKKIKRTYIIFLQHLFGGDGFSLLQRKPYIPPFQALKADDLDQLKADFQTSVGTSPQSPFEDCPKWKFPLRKKCFTFQLNQDVCLNLQVSSTLMQCIHTCRSRRVLRWDVSPELMVCPSTHKSWFLWKGPLRLRKGLVMSQ